ncbi:MAG: hypothetical protein PVSMB4_02890 [Ktedonobacterales bacterium]
MIVHRLRAWFSRVVAVVASQRRAYPGGRTLPPVHALAIPMPGTAARLHGTGLASSHWLDDSRRLRMRPSRPPALPPPSREHLRQILRDPRWAAVFDLSQPSRSPRAPQVAQQAIESAPSRPLATPIPPTSEPSLSDEERRRLVFLRQMVRRGVYNEGFAPAQLPEQYRPPTPGPESPPPESPRA